MLDAFFCPALGSMMMNLNLKLILKVKKILTKVALKIKMARRMVRATLMMKTKMILPIGHTLAK
jgi:hypothetical protein